MEELETVSKAVDDASSQIDIHEKSSNTNLLRNKPPTSGASTDHLIPETSNGSIELTLSIDNEIGAENETRVNILMLEFFLYTLSRT